jgi:hypothetical protein
MTPLQAVVLCFVSLLLRQGFENCVRLLGHCHQAELELGPRLHHPCKYTDFIKGTVHGFKSKLGQPTEPVFLKVPVTDGKLL